MKKLKFSTDWSVTKKVPEPKEVKGTYGIAWGRKNDYPQFLNRLADESSMHANILNSKVNYITSAGLKFEGDEIAFASFANNVKGEYKLQELYEAITNDRERYNGCAILVCFDLAGDFSYFEPIGFDELRTNKDYSTFWHCKNWENQSELGIKEYPAYDPENPRGKMVLYFPSETKSYDKNDLGVYPKPLYSGGIPAMMTEAEINYFGFYEVINGFKSGTHIHFRDGRPENAEDEDEIRDEIQMGGTNRDASGSLLVTFGEEDVSINSLVGNDLPDRYANQYEQVTKSILYSHSITTPALFGVQTPGSLGNSNELQVGFNAFVEGYVKAAHQFLKVPLKYLMQIAGVEGEIKLCLPDSPLSVKESDSLLEKIQKAPQVVATKLVNALSNEQVLEAFGIEPTEKPAEQPTEEEGDPVLNELMKVGEEKSKFKVIAERNLPAVFTSEELDTFEKELKGHKFVDGRDLGVLIGIENGDSVKKIARSLGITQVEVRQIIDTLTSLGFIDSDGNVTPDGLDQVSKEQRSFDIVYEYVKTPGVEGPPDLGQGRTRDFCRTLLRSGKVFTREEISTISSRVGRDVWTYRGGWWNDGGKNKPFCRHSWSQLLIER